MSASRARVMKFRAIGWIVVVSMLVMALGGPSAAGVAATGSSGNNGTVKVHDGAGEPASERRNEPHVCTFHLHFFGGDDHQSGTWEIKRWAPGPRGQVVLTGTYDTGDDDEDRRPHTGTYSLPNGHYKLFWDGDIGKHDKHKVFRVKCEQESQSPSTSPSHSKSPKPSHSKSPKPSDSASPSPTHSKSPKPSHSKSPKPSHSKSPKPSHSKSPKPSHSKSPKPSDSASPSPTKSASPSPTASASASPSPTRSASPSPTRSASPSPTATPSGTVVPSESASASPSLPTLPPTDILAGEAQPSPDSWRLMLVAIAGLLASVLVLTPNRRRR